MLYASAGQLAYQAKTVGRNRCLVNASGGWADTFSLATTDLAIPRNRAAACSAAS
jgi:hypothetical protein